jgi:PAS domain S-box-containing protein
MNGLLTHQIKKHFGSLENLPFELTGIINDIDHTYESFNDDVLLLKNSIEISSQELRNAYEIHKQNAETQKETFSKIKDVLSALNLNSQNEIIEVDENASTSMVLFDSLIRLIEERKLADEALQESETRFRFVSDNAPVLIWKSGTDTLCDYFNQTWLDFTGRTLEQEMGNGWAKGVHPDDFQYCLDTYLDSFNERRKFSMEYRLMHADGKYRWLLDNGVPKFTSQGIFTGYIGTCTDITENKRVEETFRNLSRAVDQSPSSILITDTKVIIEYGNPKVFELAGYEPEELLGRNIRIFSSGEKTQEDYKHLWETILSGKEWKGEFHNKKKNGDLYWESESISAIKNSDGKIVNFLAVKEDITGRKQIEEALKNSEENFRNVVEMSPSPNFVHQNSIIIYANPASLRMMRIEKLEDVIGTNILDWVHPDFHQVVVERTRKVIEEGNVAPKTEVQFIRADGTVGDTEAQSTPIIYGGLPAVNIALNDISDRKLSEVAIQAAHKSLSDLLNAAIHTSIISTDTNGIITVFSKGAEKMLGYSAEEVVGKTTPACFHSESEAIERGKELTQEFGRPITGFEVFSANAQIYAHDERTWTYIHKNGTRIIVNLIITAIRNTNEELIGFLGIASDVTKRKEAEEALLESSKKWEAIISASPDGIGIVSFDGKLEFMSDQLAKMYGYSAENKEEYIEKSIFEFIDPSSHQLLTNNFHVLLGGNKDFETTEYLAVKKDNSRINIEVKSAVLLDMNGNPANILFIERDITERKKIEAELEESREKYRGLSEASFEAIFISEKGICIEQNLAAELMFGFSSEEAMNRFGTDWIAPEDREMVMNNMISGYEAPYEAMALRKDGTTFPCVLNGRMMYFRGRVVRVTSLSDISSLKKVEQELINAKEKAEESEQKFISIIQSQSEGIGFVDQNEVFEFANKATERIFETGDNELIGTSLYDYLKPDERNKVDQQTHNRGEGYVNTYELQIITKKGNAKYIHVTATPKRDSNDNYLGAYGVFQDITDRKKAEDEVKRVSMRLALATRAGGVGVWEFDIISNALLWDDQMFVLYGVEKNNFAGTYQTWRSGLHPNDVMHADAEIQMAIRGEKDFNTEFRVCWPDGSVHNLRALATVQCDDSGIPVSMIGTNWDITEQKKTEAVLFKAKQDADAANKSKSIFLANMSHEIRTPLNAIIGFSQLMKRDKHLNDKQKEYTTSIIRAGEHLMSLINDILELSKMEAGRLEVTPTTVDLNALLNDIHLIFSESARSKHLQFIFETADRLPTYIIVDDNKLRRILINLVGNAIKFTDEGCVAFRARVDKTDELKNRLVVEIQDSGPGIPANEIDKLFKHFVQTSTGINKSTGSGLGLALSRELAILMGGEIHVTSEVGKGSVFTVEVDIEIGTEDAILDVTGKHVTGYHRTGEAFRILVVDDIEENIQIVVTLLNLVGFETMEAVNGIDAIAKCEAWNPHLILMDLRMPVMDGYEATRHIKATEKGKRIPIIALTTSSFEDERRIILEQGMQTYIRKPFRESDLFGTIGKILGIQYTYDDETLLTQEQHFNDEGFAAEISKLPNELVIKMQNAVAAADLDLLIDLIQKIDPGHSVLSRHLMLLTNNFDFNYLKKILSKKEIV